MKYSVQQIEEALKGGRSIQYITSQNEYFSCRYDFYSNQVTISTDHLILGNIRLNEDLKFLLKCFELNIYNCTKIEGEETMEKKTPHKHAELIKLWADTGCQIQYKYSDCETWHDCNNNRPYWELDNEYRVKPTLVKKWKWVYETPEGNMIVTCLHYSSPEEFNNLNPYNKGKILQKVDSTMIEVEE